MMSPEDETTMVPIYDREGILVIGDSHVELPQIRDSAFAQRLREAFGVKYRVALRGLPGKNTTGILAILPHLIDPKPTIRAVMLVMGSNSECHDERWESAETIRNNIQSMIDTLKKEWPNIFILLNTPPPIRDDPQLKTIVENGRETNILWREQKRIAEISDVIREFEGPNIGICDLYKALSDRPDKRWYIDGVHLSEAAEEEVWADLAVQGLEAGL